MGDKYNVRDRNGHIVGTVEKTSSSADGIVGTVLFFYIFRWPLLIFLILAIIITAPMIVIDEIGEAIEKAKNPALEQKYTIEITNTINQGIAQLNESLRLLTIVPNMNKNFTDEAIDKIAKELKKLQDNNIIVDQNIKLIKVVRIRWLQGGYDVEKMSKANNACAIIQISGTLSAKNTTNMQTIYLDKTNEAMRVGLKRDGDRWIITEILEYNVIYIYTSMMLMSYCQN